MRRGLLGLALVAGFALVAAPALASTAAEPRFGPVSSGIYPGMATQTKDAFCTANFAFVDADADVYFGQSAHCARKAQKEVPMPNGCTFGSLPLGTKVALADSGVQGTMVYSSWLAMQKAKETDVFACTDNDFALIKVPRWARNQVNPSIPLFGGPTGLNTTGTQPGDAVVGYGNSPSREDLEDVKPKQSVSVGTVNEGWRHLIYSVTPGIPGDSGGPYLDAEGRALGSLSVLVLNPAPASNAITDIHRALEYAKKHSGIKGLRLAKGTETFQGPSVASPLLNQAPTPPATIAPPRSAVARRGRRR
ncbi:MAG: serine protease [Sporichthyaceae bacterium]